MTYDWTATLVFFVTLVALTLGGRYLAFMVPDLQRMRELNGEADHEKLSNKDFRAAVKSSNTAALVTNAVVYLTILPLCLNLESRPLWRHAVDVVMVLMLFDFFYYVTHRFVFHGKLMRREHSLHHQAHTPTHVDALYVHPLETTIGLLLFLGSIPLVALATGAPLNAFSMAVATLIFTQVSTINHTFVDLPYFPFKTLDHLTSIHAAHHVDMNCGNYATFTMFFDRLFGTLEKPVSRSTP
jgi:sterol desaturase/sphingolipid hydroxylase (fatty acid hydroxylase superfamily)